MTMNNTEIKKTVVEIVAGIVRCDNSVFDEHTPFNELGVDDLDFFELILKIEDSFMLEISDADTQKLTSIATTVSYIAARKA